MGYRSTTRFLSVAFACLSWTVERCSSQFLASTRLNRRFSIACARNVCIAFSPVLNLQRVKAEWKKKSVISCRQKQLAATPDAQTAVRYCKTREKGTPYLCLWCLTSQDRWRSFHSTVSSWWTLEKLRGCTGVSESAPNVWLATAWGTWEWIRFLNGHRLEP